VEKSIKKISWPKFTHREHLIGILKFAFRIIVYLFERQTYAEIVWRLFTSLVWFDLIFFTKLKKKQKKRKSKHKMLL